MCEPPRDRHGHTPVLLTLSSLRKEEPPHYTAAMLEGALGSGACVPASVLGHPLPSESVITWGGERGKLARSVYMPPAWSHTVRSPFAFQLPTSTVEKMRSYKMCENLHNKDDSFLFQKSCNIPTSSTPLGRALFLVLSPSAVPSILTEMGAMSMHSHTPCCPLGSYLSPLSSACFKDHTA